MSNQERRPDVMGGPGDPSDVMEGGRASDVMEGGEEPAGENPDVMSPDAEHSTDVLEGGREPAGEEPDVMDARKKPR